MRGAGPIKEKRHLTVPFWQGAVSFDRKLYGITKGRGRLWGNEALPGQSPGKLTSLPLANSANTTHRAKRRQARADVAALPGLRPGKPAPQRAAFGNAKCLGTKRKKAPYGALFSFGGDDRDRTDYLLNAIQALSQVSYTPECLIIIASPPPACKRFFQNCSGLSKTLLLFHKQCCHLSALHNRGRGIAEGKTAVRNRKAKAEKPIRTGKSSQNPLKKPNYRRCFSAKMPIE